MNEWRMEVESGEWAVISLSVSPDNFTLVWFLSHCLQSVTFEGACLAGSSKKMAYTMGARHTIPWCGVLHSGWLVGWNYTLKELLWAGQGSDPLWTTLFLWANAFWVQMDLLPYRILDDNLSVIVVEDCHHLTSHLGFYSLLTYKWTTSHFFVEGAEPEVFPSEM